MGGHLCNDEKYALPHSKMRIYFAIDIKYHDSYQKIKKKFNNEFHTICQNAKMGPTKGKNIFKVTF